MKLSFSTVGYGSFLSWVPCYTIDEAVRRISGWGYDGVEVGACRPHAYPWDVDAEERERIRGAVAGRGLEVSAVCPVNYEYNLGSCLDKERRATVEYYVACLELARDLGAKAFVCVPGWVVYPTSPARTWKWIVEGLAEVAERGKDTGVAIAIEAINGYSANLVNRTNDAVRLRDELGLPNVKLMVDTQHLFLAQENPVDAVYKCGPDLVHVHVADTLSSSPERFPAGKGSFGFKSFIKALKDIGYEGHLSAELWGPNPDQLAYENATYLREMVSTT